MSLKAHWAYLKYVAKHKKYVYEEGRKLGVGRWQLLKHDLSKLSPSEWSPYVRKFYGHLLTEKHFKQILCHLDKNKDTNRLHERHYSRVRKYSHERINQDFKRAWLHHQNVNPHHWQYWVLLNDFGCPETCLEMPEEYMLEMIADWKAAGRGNHNQHEAEVVSDKLREFYTNTVRHRRLHPITKMKVEALIEVEVPSLEILNDPGYKEGEEPISSGWTTDPVDNLNEALSQIRLDMYPDDRHP